MSVIKELSFNDLKQVQGGFNIHGPCPSSWHKAGNLCRPGSPYKPPRVFYWWC